MKIVLFFLIWHKNFKIAFLRVSGNLCLAFENFHIGTNIWSVSGNFQQGSGNVDHTKYYICFLSYDTTNFQIAQSFRHVSVSFDCLLENVQISKKFRPLSENFPHMSRFFFKMKMNIFYHMLKNFWRVFKKISFYMNIILFFYPRTHKFSGLLKNFRIAMLPCYRGFSLSGSNKVKFSKCKESVFLNSTTALK